MSHIIVHRLEDIARRHAARLQQVAALPPQLSRVHGEHWDFERKPFAHDYQPRQRGRVRPGLIADATEGGAPTWPVATPAQAPCLRSQSLVVYLSDGAMASTFYLASSTQTVPWRFRIRDIALNHLSNTAGGYTSWNAYVGYENHQNARLSSPPSGEAVFIVSSVTNSLNVGNGARVLGPRVNGYAVDSIVPYRGGGPFESGQTITVAASVANVGAGDFEAYATIEVEECEETYGGAARIGEPIPGPISETAPGAVRAPLPDWMEVF